MTSVYLGLFIFSSLLFINPLVHHVDSFAPGCKLASGTVTERVIDRYKPKEKTELNDLVTEGQRRQLSVLY